MEATAGRLGIKPVKIQRTDLEKKAAKLIPKPTSKVKMEGYGGYRKLISKVPSEERKKYPIKGREIASRGELQLLINGKRSVLDIKNMLDAQYQRESKLQSVLNYIEILKLAGLVKM
jgi:hypothetical protein